ncbi:ATP-binding cassette, subfamily B [Sporobacter termitidis DSM 10068]|uniref:ATP-binding cassette, subfamily B n=1 Tax=Sporobacter termitidis DSM 10068 TaxID=1123282 RepID=A0A1M5TCB4_9FIRM|nr:ABC transporter ATP-binding protein [Sporobacter termitidis]SHH48358.1 ATP-binding cassette, subfamily B [Sporobacter termitidis DSM 10068]
MSMIDEKDFQNKKIRPDTWKVIFKFAANYKKSYVKVLGGGMLAGLIDLAMSFMTMWAIDGFMAPGTTRHLPVFIAVIVAMQAVLCLTVLMIVRNSGYLEANLCADVRRAAFRKLQTMSFSYFDKTAVGYLISRLTNDMSRITEIISWTGIDLGWGVMAIISSLIAMFAVNFKLALITAASVPFLALVSIFFQKKILRYQRESRKYNSMITSGFNEGIASAQTTKTLVREELNNEDFFTVTGNMKRATMRAAMISAVYLPVASLIISVAIGFVLVKGGHDVLGSLLTVGQLNFFINIGNMMFEPIRNFAGIFAEFQSSQAAAERVVDVLTATSDITDTPEVTAKYGDSFKPARENWEPITGDVEFKNVSFCYKENEPVLKNFSLKVNAGENIALVGATGGGKSTIVNLVCRFYEPNAGELLIDGVNVQERSQLWLQSSLGYVLQTPHLFSGTIRENIRYGRLDATDGEVEEAAKTVGAHEFIMKLEKGYETEAGEGGNLMSTGQKQLISFARAILADPRIFVLDEATSSIDTESEMKIETAVETLLKNRTSFIIAHRLSTVRNADRILVIDDGEVVEQGSHKQLMKSKGRYFELYMNQFKSEQSAKSLAVT